MNHLAKLARLIDDSGLSRRQFARAVMGRDETTIDAYFNRGQRISGPTRRWIQACESVQEQSGRIVVVLRYFGPTRKQAKTRTNGTKKTG